MDGSVCIPTLNIFNFKVTIYGTARSRWYWTFRSMYCGGRQYFTYKILHGGRFCSSECESSLVENMIHVQIIPSLKLNEDRNKKVFTAIWDYIGRKCWIYSCWQALFCLIIQGSNLDGGTLNLNGGTLNLDGGKLNLDGVTLNLHGERVSPTI